MTTRRSFPKQFRLTGWLAAAILCFGGAVCVNAQQQPAPPSPPPATSAADQQPAGPVIKKETKLVLVDAVVTDKKGNYVRDLKQGEFKVYEDNKEQAVTNFSSGAESVSQSNGQRHYLILFFDNSTMAAPDQIQARGAAQKFIEANASPDSLMAVVDFGGSLRIVQNFTASSLLLRAAVSGIKNSSVDPNAAPPDVPVTVASAGLQSTPLLGASSLSNAEADFGARSVLLAIRSLAKNLRAVPGRKMLILFSGGFPLSNENQSELTATIDACNKANVAIYAVDARGLLATAPGGTSLNRTAPDNSIANKALFAKAAGPGAISSKAVSAKARSVASALRKPRKPSHQVSNHPRLVLASYPALGTPEPQRPGGGGGGTGGGGGGRGGTGGGERGWGYGRWGNGRR